MTTVVLFSFRCLVLVVLVSAKSHQPNVCGRNCKSCERVGAFKCDANSCENGYYLHNETQNCRRICGSNCKSCEVVGAFKCDAYSCENGYYLHNETQTCKPICAHHCTACDTVGSGRCDVDACEDGYYFNNQNKTCKPEKYSTSIRSTDDSKNCLKTKNGADYNGTLNITETGKICLMWSDVLFLDVTYKGYAKKAKNYCRNLNGALNKPWCYVLGSDETFEYCDIPECKQETKENEQNNEKQKTETQKVDEKKLIGCPNHFVKVASSATQFTCLRVELGKFSWKEAYDNCSKVGNHRGRLIFLDSYDKIKKIYSWLETVVMHRGNDLELSFHVGRILHRCNEPYQFKNLNASKPLSYTSRDGSSLAECTRVKGTCVTVYVVFNRGNHVPMHWKFEPCSSRTSYICEVPLA